MAISSAVDPSAVARVVGIKTTFKNLRQGNVALLPQRLAVVGQGSTVATYPTTKKQVFSASEAGSIYGFGSPIHLAVKQLLPVNGDGVGAIPVTIYPLVDDGSGVASSGDITPVGTTTKTQAYTVLVNEIPSEAFIVSASDSVATIVTAMTAAINAALDVPMVATDSTTTVDVDSKWKGASANDLSISIAGDFTDGLTFTITQPVSGAVNPDVDDALNQVGNVWETMFLNCMDVADTATLDKFSAFGEGRWGPLVRKPMVAFVGTNEASVTTAIAIPDARGSDRVNSQLVAPGSGNLPFVIAARQLARIVALANNNPPHDYGSQRATGLTPGLDSEQWTYAERDTAVKAGSSTVEVKDSVVNVSDVVTFYHPVGEEPPAYRHVVDIVKLQNIIFNLDLLFANTEWDGAPLLPDDQPTSNRSAKKPKTAKALVASMLDSLGLEAIISDPETAKAIILAQINESNPKRLDLVVIVQLSGNANIISIDLDFGFFFGTATVVA